MIELQFLIYFVLVQFPLVMDRIGEKYRKLLERTKNKSQMTLLCWL